MDEVLRKYMVMHIVHWGSEVDLLLRHVHRSQSHTKSLTLLIFDTAKIEEFNKCDRSVQFGSRPLYAPAKYALCISESGDIDIFAQLHLSDDGYMGRAVWFNNLGDVTAAVDVLKETYPGFNFGDRIIFYDWPNDPDLHDEDGSSIETPKRPVVKTKKV